MGRENGKEERAAFTLVELIAVMAILAILLAITVPQMMGYIKAAHESAAETEANIVTDAVQRYLDDHKEDGLVTSAMVWKLFNAEINDPDGVLADYVSGGGKEARIFSVNVDRETGGLKSLVYKNRYNQIKVTVDEEGNRTLENVDPE